MSLSTAFVRLASWWADGADRRRDDRGEGVVSAAIGVLVMAGIGALIWVGLKAILS